MSTHQIILPSKPKVIEENNVRGVYEIDGLYPGYGHTLGNSLRRIILSSLPGAAITKVHIQGVEHEFSALHGVKEDIINLLLNIKRIRLISHTTEPQTISLKVKGVKEVTAADLECPSQIELITKDIVIAHITDKATELNMELTVESGLGYMSREMIEKDRSDIGSIAIDAVFTPIRKVLYEVEDMRVGDRTNFNRLRLIIETDGSITPKEALERSISLMIEQLKAIVGFKEPVEEAPVEVQAETESAAEPVQARKDIDIEVLKTRIEDINLSARTVKSLTSANIRTVGGLARKREADVMEIDGLGAKGVQEIKKALGEFGITLK